METRSLSAVEARVVLSLEADRRVEVSLDSIQQRGRVSRGFARKLAHSLVAKGWLQRVGRGAYLLSPARHGPDAAPDTDPLRFGTRIARPYLPRIRHGGRAARAPSASEPGLLRRDDGARPAPSRARGPVPSGAGRSGAVLRDAEDPPAGRARRRERSRTDDPGLSRATGSRRGPRRRAPDPRERRAALGLRAHGPISRAARPTQPRAPPRLPAGAASVGGAASGRPPPTVGCAPDGSLRSAGRPERVRTTGTPRCALAHHPERARIPPARRGRSQVIPPQALLVRRFAPT